MLFWRNRHEVSDEELNAFVDGELEESVRRRVERHIESCPACGKTVAELQAVSRAMSELPAVRAPRSFALREADVNPAPASGGTGMFGSVTPLLSGVAAIAIVAFVVLAGVDITGNSTGDFDADTGSRTSATVQEGDGSADSFAAYNAGEEEPVTEDAAEGAPAESNDASVPPRDAEAPGDDESAIDNDSNTGTGDDLDEPLALELGDPPEFTERDGEGSIADTISDDDGDSTGLRVAESVAAAVAIAAGGSVLLIWWRRRATAG